MNKHVVNQLSDTDLRLLRIYRTVVESGGFSAAEAVLNISTAAISAAVTDLETRLGFRLCERGRAGFSLSSEGREIYQYILQLLSAIENFKTQVNDLHSTLKGELNIGITDNLVSMPKMHITDSLAKLKDAGPDVIVNIRMIPPIDIERGVLNGNLHIGILPRLKQLKGLEYTDLYRETSKLYCAAKHPLFKGDDSQIDLQRWSAVLPRYEQSAEIKQQLQQLKTEGAASATDREGIAFLILTGRYIGYLPDHFAERWVDAGTLRVLETPDNTFETQMSVITRKGAAINPVAQVYLNDLLAYQRAEQAH
ncbi:MAG: LysR family transcriptional regulator [Pseudomonadales bacterium]